MVARHRDRLLPRPSRLDGVGAAAAGAFGGLRAVRRPSLAARLDALVRRCGVHVAVREWRGGDETHAGARGARRARPDPPDPALGHAGRHAARRGDRSRRRARDRAPRARRRVAGRGLATRRAAADDRRRRRLAHACASARRAARGRFSAGASTPRGRAARRSCRGCRCSPRPSSSRTASSSRSGWRCRAGRELRADAYAVRVTGGADAFVTSMRRLSQTNLVDDRPPRLARCCPRTRRCAIACWRRCARPARGREAGTSATGGAARDGR